MGFTVSDAYTLETGVKLHAKLLLVVSDLRGLQSLMQCGGTPSRRGCLKCWFESIGKAGGNGKMLYNGHYVLLPQNHPLRTPLCELHNRTGADRNPNERSELRYRSHDEVMARLTEPASEALGGALGEGFPGK